MLVVDVVGRALGVTGDLVLSFFQVNLEAVDFNEEWTSLFQRHALLVVVVVIVVVLVVVIVVVVEVGVGLGSDEDTDDGVGGLVALDVDVVAERLVV